MSCLSCCAPAPPAPDPFITNALAEASASQGVVTLDAQCDADVSVMDLLNFLGSGTIAAIRLKNVASRAAAEHIAAKALSDAGRTEHAAVPGLGIIGLPMYLAALDPETRARYHLSAGTFAPLMREFAYPFGSPLDVVMAVMANRWPRAVTPLTLDDGRRCPPAILRLYDSGDGVFPHIDDIRQELPEQKSVQRLDSQFGLNVYISLPSSGGELLLYRRRFEPAEFKELAGESYGIGWKQAGDPQIVITPEVGEAIWICTTELHAVAPCRGSGNRVTLSSFVATGCRGSEASQWA